MLPSKIHFFALYFIIDIKPAVNAHPIDKESTTIDEKIIPVCLRGCVCFIPSLCFVLAKVRITQRLLAYRK